MNDKRRAVAAVVTNTLLALGSAGLLALALPATDMRWLAPLALTPLLIALSRSRSGWERFAYGWAAGIFFWAILCLWIQFVLAVHGGMGEAGGWGCFALFALYKGLQTGIFGWLGGPLLRRTYAVPAIAALWTGIERTHGTLAFAWLDLGNAAIDMSLPLRLAPIIGVYGISFAFAMMAAGLACVLLRYERKRLWPLAALGCLWLLPRIPEGMPATQNALLVQPNISVDAEWTDASREQTERQLTLLSNALPAPLVIWPELPAPLYFYDDPEFRRLAVSIAARHGRFLFGTVAYTGAHQPLNTALLIGQDGAEAGRYDKIDLVPFGEFVPPFFSFVNRITPEAGDFVPGHEIKVLRAGDSRMGVFICYEAAFPDLVRQFTRAGANVLVNLSNDGYFGHSAAHEQHLLIARMRAVENRRFLIRATNDGISAVIDPAGRIRQSIPVYRQAAAPIRYGLVEGTTFYAQHGDWFAWGCLLVGLSLAGRELVTERRGAKP